ncbi:MAG: hypothetical protein U0236_20025 [Nitrospira sp.]
MWSQDTVRAWHDRVVGACLLVLGLVLLDGCGERENVLVIEKPTEVHAITQAVSTPDPNTNIEPGKVILMLKAGEMANVVAVYHGQAHDGFKVKLADGTEGLIMAGDTFKVTSR